MLYFLLSLLAFIACVVAFIAHTYRWLSNVSLGHISFLEKYQSTRVIHHAYRAQDFVYEFKYTEDDHRRFSFSVPRQGVEYLYYRDHKKHLIERAAADIGVELLKHGAIKVNELVSVNDPPWIKTVNLVTKVYISE